MEHLAVSKVCDLLGLQPPYFAFSELQGKPVPASVRGTFSAEQALDYERGSISTAELGRHLATLGSCAAVVDQTDGRTYYLATKGRLKMIANTRDGQPSGRTFQAIAEVLHQDKRSLTAHCVAFDDDEPFAHLYCEYQVLPESVFTRVFKNYRTPPVPRPDDSPYKEPIPLSFEQPTEMSLVAHCEQLPLDRFAGHFVEYPAWPASIIVETANRVRSRLLHHMIGKEVKYTVTRWDVEALRLVPASGSLNFHVECISAYPALSHFVFKTRIMWGEIVSSVLESEIYI